MRQTLQFAHVGQPPVGLVAAPLLVSLQFLLFIVPALLRLATSLRAVAQVLTALAQLAFFSQISPVRLSVTVPLPLSVKRGLGQVAPRCKFPSCPVPVQDIELPAASQHARLPRFGHARR
ncbi:MAG: hypothetical protein HC875_34555, partial [Anaerolineales bacterium]|nr:hypothetical protein [Anaerolineales bacterium]